MHGMVDRVARFPESLSQIIISAVQKQRKQKAKTKSVVKSLANLFMQSGNPLLLSLN